MLCMTFSICLLSSLYTHIDMKKDIMEMEWMELSTTTARPIRQHRNVVF